MDVAFMSLFAPFGNGMSYNRITMDITSPVR